MSLEQKKIVVTAGCSGLGKVFTDFLLSKGAFVIPTSRSKENIDDFLLTLDKRHMSNCKPEILCLDQQDKIEEFISNIKSKYNEGIYALVDCAVCRDKIENAFEMDINIWQQHYNVNVFGTAFLIASMADDIITKEGAIVNISSMYSAVVPDNRVYDRNMVPTSLIYASSKAAMNYITQYMAVQYASKGINVNSLLIGGIRDKDRQTDYFHKEYCSRTPLGRMAEIDEFNKALEFCLDDKNKYFTGQLLQIDGGWNLR
ncbi:SDR family NAD(P)-dependent oxidoreductase [Anaerosporobacter faecicola]|uniref:SDR family NAD(P)-dependent oxidoreductase n=1 Tax=Anaerosporobacter faecicola TaxID=2718714 RepID=UPI00143B1469|nr:SDR family oxidoreductase [Anaerosporobacter faecicola]